MARHSGPVSDDSGIGPAIGYGFRHAGFVGRRPGRARTEPPREPSSPPPPGQVESGAHRADHHRNRGLRCRGRGGSRSSVLIPSHRGRSRRELTRRQPPCRQPPRATGSSATASGGGGATVASARPFDRGRTVRESISDAGPYLAASTAISPTTSADAPVLPPSPDLAPVPVLPPSPDLAPAPAPALESAASPSFVLPAQGRYTSCFCERWGEMHGGIDLANANGTPEFAAAAGTVIVAGPAGGFGQWVQLRHDDGTVTVYGHMDTIEVVVGAAGSRRPADRHHGRAGQFDGSAPAFRGVARRRSQSADRPGGLADRTWGRRCRNTHPDLRMPEPAARSVMIEG